MKPVLKEIDFIRTPTTGIQIIVDGLFIASMAYSDYAEKLIKVVEEAQTAKGGQAETPSYASPASSGVQNGGDDTFEMWSAIRKDGRWGKLLINKVLYETKQQVLNDLDPMSSSDFDGEFEIIKIKYTVDEIYKI